MPMSRELADAIIASSKRLGVDPVDLGTTISYETGGTFDPWKKGPTTKWGEHRGLVQWGEPQREKYGVTKDSTIPEQMTAVESYLKDAGVKPGHGLLDIYSAVNAGRVGLYNRSDANNGGAPGTVADKVNYQMGPHREAVTGMLGGALPAIAPISPATEVPAVAAASAPMNALPAAVDAPAEPNAQSPMMAAMVAIAKQAAQQPSLEAPTINYFRPNAQKIAAAIARMQGGAT